MKTEQDLAEGLDYLAGSIRASLQMAWAYQPEHPFLVNSTSQHTKMGLDNPDTVYYHANVRPDVTYVVRGRRGTTVDLSFQVLGGDYTPSSTPDGSTAFDDRELRHRRRRHASSSASAPRASPDAAPHHVALPDSRRGCSRSARCTATGPAEQRSQPDHPPGRHPRHADTGAHHRGRRQAVRRRGEDAHRADQDVVRVPGVVLPQRAGEHPDDAAADPRRAVEPVVVGGPLRAAGRRGDRDHDPARGCAVPRLPARHRLVHLAWTTSATRPRSTTPRRRSTPTG